MTSFNRKRGSAFIAAMVTALCVGAFLGTAGRAYADEFLDVDDAFKVEAEGTANHDLRINFTVAEGYSLYKDRITIIVTTPGINTGRVDYPASETHTDEFFGPQQVYTHDVSLELPISCAPGASVTVLVTVTYQGCADAGLCYPFQKKELKVELPDGTCTG
jgi:thiol:disulfide interchange protein DsbD